MLKDMKQRIEKLLSDIDNDKTKTTADYVDKLIAAGAVLPKFPINSSVYIIDLYDIDNDCSLIGNGSGSKNIQERVRECFVTSCVMGNLSTGLVYYVQPHKLTQKEYNGAISFYWGRGRYEKELYTTEEDALNALKKS